MTQQQIIWTTLPNGFSGDSLRLSVYVSPRLSPDPQGPYALEPFPDFLDWPLTLERLSFNVEFEGAPTLPATMNSNPDSNIWKALFNASTYVEPYTFDRYKDFKIRSYPISRVSSFLKKRYVQIATQSKTEFPSIETLNNAFRDIIFFGVRGEEATKEKNAKKIIDEVLERKKAFPAIQSDTIKDFVQVKLFHSLRDRTRMKIEVPEFDFHKIVSSLGEYYKLLRLLGLVIDLEVAVPLDVQPRLQASKTVRVLPAARFRWLGNVTPKTKCILNFTDRTFRAEPQDSDMTNGMLQLSDRTKYDLVQVDVDGAALKAMEFANNISRIRNRKTVDTPDSASVPSLRSGGISLVRTDRAVKLAKAFGAVSDYNDVADMNNVAFSADDLVRGYRIDVWDSQSNTWHSLCRRVGAYRFLDSNVVISPLHDEGWIQTGVTQAADGSSQDLYLHESLFNWSGWSLVAPRPGKGVGAKDEAELYDPQKAMDDSKQKSRLPGLVTSFTPEQGSLPRLRFGVNYRLRARSADLAGNGPVSEDLDPSDFSYATRVVTCARFDPVNGPNLVLRRKLNPEAEESESQSSPGESLNRLVIRSDYNKPASQYNSELFAALEKTARHYRYLDYAERHVVPPRTSQLIAEMHGEFDIVESGSVKGMKADRYDDIVKRDEWNGFLLTPNTPYKDVAGQAYPLYETDDRNVYYLPDPISRGACMVFSDINGKPISTLPIWGPDGLGSFYPGDSAWPMAKTFRIRLEAEDAVAVGPNLKFDGSILHVRLPPATVIKARLSSYLDENDLDLMGMWRWIAGTDEHPMKIIPPQIAELQKLARQGQLWMLTPYRELVFVHAVQRPLVVPDLSNKLNPSKRMQPIKTLGQTYVEFIGETPIHGKSTIKLDVTAEWEEPVDPLDEPKWKLVKGKAHAFEISPIAPDDATAVFGVELQPGLFVPVVKRKRQEFGDTKHRRVTYHAIATTRFLEYLPPENTKDPANITQTSEKYDLEILNSARPAAPKILYVVPTFGWERSSSGATATISTAPFVSKRLGGGLRVYMERPWFSSGDREMLGVILWSGQDVPPEIARPYVSQWGNDPIWLSKGTPALLSYENFRPAKKELKIMKDFEGFVGFEGGPYNKSGLTLEEMNEPVSVAAYEVAYDDTRRLWYCDIVIDPDKSYYPFVRLALARCQLYSVPDTHLSRVVLADFVQLTPDRTVTITYPSNTAVDVSVSGVYPQIIGVWGASLPQTPTQVEVSVEKRQPDVVDKDLGWISVGGPNSTVPLKFTGFSEEGVGTWTGSVDLPAPLGSESLRLVIKEYEVFSSDQPSLGRRLVFAETLEMK